MQPEYTTAERTPQDAGETAFVLESIRASFQRYQHSGKPKYRQVEQAILDLVEDGRMRPDDQVPPEDILTSSLGISLGTTRRALARLAAGGVVSRRHGHGTFIASHSHALGDNWHFRFLEEGRQDYLPVYSRILSRRMIKERGRWEAVLGPDPKGYVLLERAFDISAEFSCFSEFYLPSKGFSRLITMPIRTVESVNLKKVLDSKFGKPTVAAQQHGRIEAFPARVCKVLSMPLGSVGLILEITAFTLGNAPLSFHVIYIPPNPYALELTQVQPGPAAKGTID